jgi:nucleotide-binding universal stress UspA family protein
MYQHIMLPFDGSELSLKAVNESIALAKVLGSRLTLMTVIKPYHMVVSLPAASHTNQVIVQRHDEESREAAQKMQADVVAQAKSSGIQCESVVVLGESPYREIIERAAARKCDLIVMASHGRRGLDAVLLGSETVKVLTHSKVPVLVVR